MSKSPQVLLGDSSPSSFPPNVLDLLVQLVQCVREVGTAYAENDNLELQKGESVEATASILADLDRFKHQCEIGLRATATDSVRAEVHRHAEEAIAHVNAMVDGWRRSYAQAHDREENRIAQRTRQLEAAMKGAIQKFLLPLRQSAGERRLHRLFDGEKYNNTMDAEFVPGLRIRLALADNAIEVPQRIRTLVDGRGIKLTVGTKRTGLLRRGEEPNVVTIDEYAVLDAEVTPDTARLVVTKKQGSADTFTLEMTAVGDGARGRIAMPDGTIEAVPGSDAPVLNDLWRALQNEVLRLLGAQAQVVGLILDEEQVDDSAMMLRVAERLVETYRPVVSKIAEHSPNPEELTIKIARADGRREEAYVYRADLAQHLLALPAEVRARLTIPELVPNMADPAPSPRSRTQVAGKARGADFEVDVDVEEDGVPQGAPTREATQDLSLQDLVVEGSTGFPEEDATKTLVRRTGGE